jgi:hypothetical protein
MIIWVDAQLPLTLAAWIVETFGITALSLKELGVFCTNPRKEGISKFIYHSYYFEMEVDTRQKRGFSINPRKISEMGIELADGQYPQDRLVEHIF